MGVLGLMSIDGKKSVCSVCGYVNVKTTDEASILVHPLSDGTESVQQLIDRHFAGEETKTCACPACSKDTARHFSNGVQCNAHKPRARLARCLIVDPA